MAEMKTIAIKDIALNYDRKEGGGGNIELLAQSIAQVGLINPITVRKGGDAVFPYTIIAGRRRVEAAILLNHTEIAAVVYEESETAGAGFCCHLALAENINRLAMHPLDEGAQYARLLKVGYTLDDLRARFDRSASHIYQRMKLNDLIQEVQELFREGKIKISAAAKIASLPKRVQKEIYANLKKERQWMGDHEKTIDRVIGQMMRMPLDFPCDACEHCTAKRTHYGSAALFPEYSDERDYCMDSRCYEKNIRSFFHNAISEFLKNWHNLKAVYIYEECKEDAERLRSILDKKPLTGATSVRVYHESFEDCRTIRVLDDEESERVLCSQLSAFSKDYFIAPVLYFQDKWQEPIWYIAVDDESYEKLFPSCSYETEEVTEIDAASESERCNIDADTDTGKAIPVDKVQSNSEADVQKTPVLTPDEQADVFKRTVLEYLRLERKNTHHPFFYSTVFRNILEKQTYFEEAFQIVTGVSGQDFYQKKKYEDLTYQQLLEIYVYSAILTQGLANLYRATGENDIPILKKMGLDGALWRGLYENMRRRFLKEGGNAATSEAAEKKTAVTAAM